MTSTLPTVIGAATTVAVAAGGWVMVRRRNEAEGDGFIASASGAIVDASMKLVAQHEADEHECRAELERVRAVQAEHERRLAICDQHRAHDAEVIAALAHKLGVDIASLTVED